MLSLQPALAVGDMLPLNLGFAVCVSVIVRRKAGDTDEALAPLGVQDYDCSCQPSWGCTCLLWRAQ